MNYRKTYDSLIAFRRLTPPIGYKEKHHVLPKSMGGRDDDSNLVYLTAREHFVAHRLLLKIHRNRQMAWALHLMMNCKAPLQDRVLAKNSRKYNALREDISALRKGAKHAPHTEEAKEKMRQAHRGKPKSEEHRRKLSIAKAGKPGPTHTEETRRQMSESAKKRIENPNRGSAISAGKLGKKIKPRTPEHLAAIAEGRRKAKESRLLSCTSSSV